MTNPLDEYLELRQEKTAGPGGTFLREMAQGANPASAFGGAEVGKLLTQTAVVGGVGALIGAARKAYSAATKTRDYKMMLEVNPDLSEAQAGDPKMFNQLYSSLRSLNPTFASDPVVAGSYMRKMTEFPHNAGPILVETLGYAPKPSGLRDFSASLDIAQRASRPPTSEKDRLQAEKLRFELEKMRNGGGGGYEDAEEQQ